MKYTEINQDGSIEVSFTLMSVRNKDSKAFYEALKVTGHNSNFNFEHKRDIGRF